MAGRLYSFGAANAVPQAITERHKATAAVFNVFFAPVLFTQYPPPIKFYVLLNMFSAVSPVAAVCAVCAVVIIRALAVRTVFAVIAFIYPFTAIYIIIAAIVSSVSIAMTSMSKCRRNRNKAK